MSKSSRGPGSGPFEQKSLGLGFRVEGSGFRV